MVQSIWKDLLNETLVAGEQRTVLMLSKVSILGFFGLTIKAPVKYLSWIREEEQQPIGIWEFESSMIASLIDIPFKAILGRTSYCFVLDWGKDLKNWVHDLISWCGLIEERLQQYIPNYQKLRDEKAANSASVPLAPLADGILTKNLGVELTVVLANSHLSADIDEEKVDYVIQTIRGLCLAYGASLFSLSPNDPTTVSALKFHLSSNMIPEIIPPDIEAIDRQRLAIPWKWDSFAKIDVLRPGFHAKPFFDKQFDLIAADFTEALADVISLKTSPSQNLEEEETDEQDFLDSLLQQTGIEATVIAPSAEAVQRPAAIKQTKPVSPAKERAAGAPTEDVSSKIARLLEQSNAIKEKYSSSRPAPTSGRNGTSQNEKLSSFFQSLIKK